MSESRVFMLNGTEVQAVVDRLETFLYRKGNGGSKLTDGRRIRDAGKSAEGRLENPDGNETRRYNPVDGF